MVFGRLLRGNSSSSTEASSPKGTPKLAAAAPPKEVDLTASVAELEWELVEPERERQDVEPLVMDDYLILATGGGEAGVGAEADLAAGDAAAAGRRAEEMAASQPAAEEPAAVAEEPKDQRGQAEVASRDAPVAAAGAPSAGAPEEETSFRCRACRASIFNSCDVVSANYHAQTSPGYLIGAVKNTRMSSDVQTVTYTTGQYSVQEVLCQQCSAMLGIIYTDTDSAKNQYKVGKYLVGIDRLVLPKGTVHPMEKTGHKQ